MPRMSVDFPQNISEKLEVMAKEVGMTKTALVNMAVATMVTKFDEVGMRIFFDLLTPGQKKQ